MAERVDSLISARWVVPVEPAGRVIEDGAVAVRDGRIVAVGPRAELESRFACAEHSTLPRQVLIPGLVNAHTHAAMSLLRGLADDLPLKRWLQEHIWPAESRWVSPEFVHDGTQLAIAEMLLGGTTCFNDMYFFPDAAARAAQRAGIRASLGLVVIEFPTAWGSGPDEYISKGLALRDQHKDEALLSFVFAPHAPYTIQDPALGRLRVLADELDLPIQMHVHETAEEVEEALQTHGQRPLARLQRLGLPGPNLMAVHMTQLEDAEIAELARTGTHVVHCPESNLKLASGFCPVARLLDAGVNVALGTDGAASNNDLDLLGEARTAALLAKAVAGDAAAMPADQALRMATLNGARALGLGEQTGSLEPGKWADLTAVDLDAPATLPVYNPVSQLIYAAGRDQVSDVWVAGRRRVQDHRLVDMDLDALRRQTATWRTKISDLELAERSA